MKNKTQQRRCRECDCNLLIQVIHSDLETFKTQSKFTEYKCFDCDSIQPTYLTVIDWRENESKSAQVDKLESRCQQRMELISKMRDANEARLRASIE